MKTESDIVISSASLLTLVVAELIFGAGFLAGIFLSLGGL